MTLQAFRHETGYSIFPVIGNVVQQDESRAVVLAWMNEAELDTILLLDSN